MKHLDLAKLNSPQRQRRFFPYAVLTIGLLLTIAATAYVATTLIRADRVRFHTLAREAEAKIRTRVAIYTAMLRGTKSFCTASYPPTPDSFVAYARSLHLTEQYPGAAGVGFAVRYAPAQQKDLIIYMRTHGRPTFKIWPDSDLPERTTIAFLEPSAGPNEAAVGYDMFTEPTRRAAMERARDTGAPAASGKVQLVQDKGPNSQAGFLLYNPVYTTPQIPATLDERRALLLGYVYSPFRADDLLLGLFTGDRDRPLDFEVFDDGQTKTESRMHRSANFASPLPQNYVPRYSSEAKIDIAGRAWLVRFTTRPEFHSSFNRWLPPAIAIGGLLGSLALFLATRREVVARCRAERIALDLHRSQEKLRASEARFRRLAESNLIGVNFADLDGRIIEANDAYLKIIGRSREDLAAGKVRWDAITPPDFLTADQRAIAELKAKGVCTPYEKEITRSDGTRVPIIIGSALLDPDRRDTATEGVSFVLDLTESKRAQRELQVAKEFADHARTQAEQANRLKDEFLATLSHELRTPLNAILGWAQILRTPHRTDQDSHHGLETIERNARAQAQLIEDLLDISRIISGKMRLDVRSVDLRSVIANALSSVRLAAEGKNIRLIETIEPNVPLVYGDPDRLQQVIWNLLSNAIKFTPKGGTVIAHLRRADESSVEIEVTDSGPGIPPDFLPYVFDRFRQADASTTRKYGGLGLGLAIVRNLVEQHGGTVHAESLSQGQGARFIVRLPVRTQGADTPHDTHIAPHASHANSGNGGPPASSANSALKDLRVLVVDDEPDTRELVSRMLRDHGATVFLADSAQAALDILGHNPLDILVCDIGMPEMDGYELIRRIRSFSPDRGGALPAIALTAFARPDDRKRALAAGYQLHLPKPVGDEEITNAILSLTNRVASC